jgi:hypothetical protein
MSSRYRKAGLCHTSLTIDKSNRLHCPICGCIVIVEDQNYTIPKDSSLVAWHTWECNHCQSFDEHGHYPWQISMSDREAIDCYTEHAVRKKNNQKELHQ